jgi:hypothetical protein
MFFGIETGPPPIDSLNLKASAKAAAPNPAPVKKGDLTLQ